MTTDLVKAQASYLSALAPRGASAGNGEAPWLDDLRTKAFNHFKTAGFPTPKNERWKYTDLSLYLPSEIEKGNSSPAKTTGSVLAKMKANSYETDKGHWLVFIDGVFSPEQSSLKPLAAGFEVGNLAAHLNNPKVQSVLNHTASYESDAFTAINLSAFKDGLWVFVPEGQAVAETIHMVSVSRQAIPSWTRNLIVAGANSQVSLVEHFYEEAVGPSLASSVTEIQLAAGARVSHVKIQNETGKNLHLGTVKARQESGSRFTSRVFSFGGQLVRNETETLLADRRAETVMDGLFMARGRHHVDNQTFIDHASAQCACQETYKGVLEGVAVGVFDGRVLVRENAQKTDARQSNKNLLLSKTAKIYSKPQLQIYADDVKCSHGSATGQLDEEALFYLWARGIGRAEARQILVSAFAGELVEQVGLEELKKPLEKTFQLWLRKSLEGSHES